MYLRPCVRDDYSVIFSIVGGGMYEYYIDIIYYDVYIYIYIYILSYNTIYNIYIYIYIYIRYNIIYIHI